MHFLSQSLPTRSLNMIAPSRGIRSAPVCRFSAPTPTSAANAPAASGALLIPWSAQGSSHQIGKRRMQHRPSQSHHRSPLAGGGCALHLVQPTSNDWHDKHSILDRWRYRRHQRRPALQYRAVASGGSYTYEIPVPTGPIVENPQIAATVAAIARREVARVLSLCHEGHQSSDALSYLRRS
jgi:hypothetical protein